MVSSILIQNHFKTSIKPIDMSLTVTITQSQNETVNHSSEVELNTPWNAV